MLGLAAGLALFAVPVAGGAITGAALATVSLFGLAVLFAACETAVASVRRTRLQQLVDEGSHDARSVQRLLDRTTGFVAVAELIITTALVGGSTILVAVYGPFMTLALGGAGAAYLLLAGGILLVAVVLVQQVGRALGLRHAETVALGMATLARSAVAVLSPVVGLLQGVGRLVYQSQGGLPHDPTGSVSGVTEAGIMLQVDVAEEEGVLEEEEGDMIRSIFEFGDTVAREVMVPRMDMEAADVSATIGQVLDLAVAAGHSRIPVYQDSIDRVEGIFYVKDSLRFLREGRLDVRVQEVMRPAYFVPETKKVDELLREMQSRRVHVAIVVDEYGGTAGLVTIEDILEEIVGEIQDEYDEEEAPLKHLSEHEVVVDALMTLDDVNDSLTMSLDAEDVDTLGGFVYAKLGRVPVQGDEVTANGARLIVEETEGNRINKVRIIKGADTEGDSAAGNAGSLPPAPRDGNGPEPGAA